jgi:catechol 2,3-dioxygenase-like lactoylglutathione lyase family enzyme
MEPKHFAQQITFLYAEDPAASWDFYENKLGLSLVQDQGTCRIYATAPGDVASDGIGDHSPFTTALLRNLATPGVELEQLMKRVKSEVATSTKQDQRPWTNSDLTTEVYLVPPG